MLLLHLAHNLSSDWNLALCESHPTSAKHMRAHVKTKLPQLAQAIAALVLALMGSVLVFAAAQKPTPSTPKSGATVNNPAAITTGQKIYAKQCQICHFATSKAKKIGPGLANIYPGGKFSNGKKVDDAAMRVWIESGGKDMPGFNETLKPNEIRDLIAYLRTL
jgi:cytochrome c